MRKLGGGAHGGAHAGAPRGTAFSPACATSAGFENFEDRREHFRAWAQGAHEPAQIRLIALVRRLTLLGMVMVPSAWPSSPANAGERCAFTGRSPTALGLVLCATAASALRGRHYRFAFYVAVLAGLVLCFVPGIAHHATGPRALDRVRPSVALRVRENRVLLVVADDRRSAGVRRIVASPRVLRSLRGTVLRQAGLRNHGDYQGSSADHVHRGVRLCHGRGRRR